MQDSRESGDTRQGHRVIEAHTLYSAHLQEERTIKVCLPPGYDRDRAYPVVYCQDGNEFFTHGRIATIAERMVAAGELDPLWIVGIAVNRKRRTEDYAVGGTRSEAYRRFVNEECVPFVEQRYQVQTAQRVLAGVSLGAAASLAVAVSDPLRFNKLMLFSGAFYPPAQQLVDRSPSLAHMSCYQVAGRQETELETDSGVYDFLELNRQMRDILTAHQVEVDYHEGDGKHLWGFWQSRLPEALRWLQRQLDRSR